MALAPSIGGAVAGFWRGSLALMRETPAEALRDGNVRQTSSYPLIPYSNRIANGRFTFEGMAHQLALNFGDHPHAIHGNAWQKPWDVMEVSDTQCRMVLTHRPEGESATAWPFAYRAEQQFDLSSDGLDLTLILTNEDRRAMPAGLGLHPFFPKRPGIQLQFAANGVYRMGADALPTESVIVPDEWNYGNLRALGEPRLDNCFKDWDGTARIVYAQEGVELRIEADPLFGHLVVYMPEGRDFFAVEPVSHVNNAINRADIPGNGLKVLWPGESLIGQVRFRVEIVS